MWARIWSRLWRAPGIRSVLLLVLSTIWRNLVRKKETQSDTEIERTRHICYFSWKLRTLRYICSDQNFLFLKKNNFGLFHILIELKICGFMTRKKKPSLTPRLSDPDTSGSFPGNQALLDTFVVTKKFCLSKFSILVFFSRVVLLKTSRIIDFETIHWQSSSISKTSF